MSEIDPHKVLKNIDEWFNPARDKSFECGWRIKHIREYYQKNKPYDDHLKYCLDGLAWRFDTLARDIRNISMSAFNERRDICTK